VLPPEELDELEEPEELDELDELPEELEDELDEVEPPDELEEFPIRFAELPPPQPESVDTAPPIKIIAERRVRLRGPRISAKSFCSTLLLIGITPRKELKRRE
jgi:hypothetical protein